MQLKNYKKHDYYVHIAIAPTKNHERLEWFIEKAVEIGVDEISFINCERTLRKKIRMHNTKLIRKEPDFFLKKIKERNTSINLKDILNLDEKNRNLIQKKEKLEQEKKNYFKKKRKKSIFPIKED